jgi:methylase of polypeptide subunit release factors
MYEPTTTVKQLELLSIANPVPQRWKSDHPLLESSLHQLSPYIGKLQSSIARELVLQYSSPGDLVVDPFSGAGTIALEAIHSDRRAFASDISPYAKVLTLGKARAPICLFQALDQVEIAIEEAQHLPPPDLRGVPPWVREFFHQRTLKEAINFAMVCRKAGREFLLSCFLGILHHQRPGFLSFPSSHLVPYLRDNKFPRQDYPSLYDYRPLRPRIIAKIERSLRRAPSETWRDNIEFHKRSIETLHFPDRYDAIITSPPYMNALDYGRDNRLRLWFIDPDTDWRKQEKPTTRKSTFLAAMRALARAADDKLKPGGFCVLVVGEESGRKGTKHPSREVVEVLLQTARTLSLRKVLTDDIPDIRRSRKECKDVKREHVLIFQKMKNARQSS